MRKLLILLSCFATFAFAQEDDKAVVTTDILCTRTPVAFASLKEAYGEEILLLGDSTQEQGVKTGVFYNVQTGTYTILDFNKDVACVLAVGKNAVLKLPKVVKKSML
jgi:hypothetical protein